LSRSKTIPAVAGMIAALEACKALRLSEREDPAVRLLAMRIIERARGGARDVGQLKDAALKDFPH
jgi:urease gamma subunit